MHRQSHVHTYVLARTTPVQHLGQCLHHPPCLHHATFRYASGGAASSDMGDAPINPEPSTGAVALVLTAQEPRIRTSMVMDPLYPTACRSL